VIRAATAEDLSGLAGLEVLLFGSDAWPLEALSDELAGPGRLTWVDVGDDGELRGYAVTMHVGDVVDLNRIGVGRTHQRTGVARGLLEAAVAAAREAGADRMLLEVSTDNTAALRLYAAAGFTEIDRRARYYRDGSDAVVMRRSLARGCGWDAEEEPA
jgi:ribosomal-protein-alanine N-acetyltransferase